MAFEGLSEKLGGIFKSLKNKGKLTESDIKEVMRQVRMALLEADVSFKVAKQFVADVTEKCVGADVMESLTPAQQVIKIVNAELCELMGNTNSRIAFASKGPTVVLVCGLQGGGKTTHCAKLAYLMKGQGKRPLLVACDIYRPAAIDQLVTVGKKAGVPVFEMGQTDPVRIVTEALKHAQDHGNDLVILDTAGRLHVDEALMEELKNIKTVAKPNEILLVVDAMTGQDAVNVAEQFNEAIGIDGVILTKMDSDSRGGAALTVRAVTGKPVKFIGVGEKIDQLEVFHPDRMANRILGMGDMLTLIEKAEKQFDEKQAEETLKKLQSNRFNFNDLLEQFEQIEKMGDLKETLKMLPGVGNKLKDVEIDPRQMARVKALIYSMTPQERTRPDLITPPRKRRIAAGSGNKVEDVNRLLKQLEQMRDMMKQFGKMGKRGRRFF
ncbi:MAG: signal recognition particle protein [Clostridia bacterium]|nr:signal recognition particle protein [Clostridia bacterium]